MYNINLLQCVHHMAITAWCTNYHIFKALYMLLISKLAISLFETWLSETITDLEILPQGYSLYRKDRGSHGGGVMLAISNTLAT